MRYVRLGLMVGALCACQPAPRVGPPTQGGVAADGHFSSLVQTIFVPRCATSACHAGGIPPPNAPLNLEAENAYGQLVGVPAAQLPGMNLVEPGDPANSYLVLKLRGTAGDAGGVASLMPLASAALDEADIEAIEAWIADGAQND